MERFGLVEFHGTSEAEMIAQSPLNPHWKKNSIFLKGLFWNVQIDKIRLTDWKYLMEAYALLTT